METIYLICIIRLDDTVKIYFIRVYVYYIILAISEVSEVRIFSKEKIKGTKQNSCFYFNFV